MYKYAQTINNKTMGYINTHFNDSYQIQSDPRFVIYCASAKSFVPSSYIQQERLIQQAEKEEINVVGIYVDQKNQTKQFYSLLKIIQNSDAEGLLIWDISVIPNSSLFQSMIDKNEIRYIKTVTQTIYALPILW